MFTHHYAIITLINDMNKDGCPCEKESRNYIYYFSIAHAVLCFIIFVKTLANLLKLRSIEDNPKEIKKFSGKRCG